MEATPQQAKAFGAALQDALIATATSRDALAQAIGKRLNEKPVVRSAVQQWIAGKNEPSRARVIAAEEVLRLPPGALSRHLGYLPVTAQPVKTVRQAIESDPALKESDRRVLLASYRAMTRS